MMMTGVDCSPPQASSMLHQVDSDITTDTREEYTLKWVQKQGAGGANLDGDRMLLLSNLFLPSLP